MIRRLRVRLAVIGVIGASGILVGPLGGGSALAAGTPSPVTSTTLTPMEQTALLAGEFNVTAVSRFPASFGGLEVTGASDVTVYVAAGQELGTSCRQYGRSHGKPGARQFGHGATEQAATA